MGEKEHLISNLKRFVGKLSKDFRISNIILFGSRARKKIKFEDIEHDVDLIIVSDDFKGKNFFERARRMYDYWDLDLPVDFLCYTNEEFNKLKNKITIVNEALKKGIIVS